MICKLSDKDLSLLAIKVLREKGSKEVTDVHVKSFIMIIRKMCEMLNKEQSD
jgi:hypothetical protein